MNKRALARSEIYLLMITLERCKQILNSKETKFSNEQVKMIREYLYLLAALEIETNKLKKSVL